MYTSLVIDSKIIIMLFYMVLWRAGLEGGKGPLIRSHYN